MRIRWKKLSKTRIFSRKDGVKVVDYGSEDEDDDDDDDLLSGKKREDESLPDKLRRLARYESLFSRYMDAHDSDNDNDNGVSLNGSASIRHETLDMFVKRIKQGKQETTINSRRLAD